MKKIIIVVILSLMVFSLYGQEAKHKRYDIVDLANKYELVDGDIKSILVGAKLEMEDGSYKKVKSYYCDYAIDMINIVFVGDTAKGYSFRFGSKFTVILPNDKYKSIKNKQIGKVGKLNKK